MNLEVDILDNPNELYTAAVEYLSTQRNSEQEAKQEAAELVEFVGKARSWQLKKERKEARKLLRARWWDRNRVKVWGSLAALVVVTGLTAFLLAMLWMKHNDHAGVDQKHVGIYAAQLLSNWYGQNEEDKLTSMTLLSKQRGDYLGKQAWVLTYKVKGAPNLVMYMTDGGTYGFFDPAQ